MDRLDIFAAVVTVHNAFGYDDFFVGDAVLIITAIGPVHDKAPDAAWPEIERIGRGAEAVGAPPRRQMSRICKGSEYQFARRLKYAAANDRAGVGFQIDVIACAHSCSPSLATS